MIEKLVKMFALSKLYKKQCSKDLDGTQQAIVFKHQKVPQSCRLFFVTHVTQMLFTGNLLTEL